MPDEYPTVKAAAVQAAPVYLDREATIAKARALIAEAGAAGAELIAFPEGFVPAHPDWFHFHGATSATATEFNRALANNAVEVPGPSLAPLCTAAREAGSYVVIGVCEKLPNTLGTLFNTQVFIGPTGEYLGKHQKLVPTFTERLVHGNGRAETFGVVGTSFGPVSSLVCGENSNPLAIFALTAEGTRIHVMSWPSHLGVNAGALPARSCLAARAFAQMSKAYVVSACATVNDEVIDALRLTPADAEFLRSPGSCGGSCIVAPDSQVIAGPMGNEEGIVYADLDLNALVSPKLFADISGHYNRPDVFQLRVARRDPQLYQRPLASQSQPNASDDSTYENAAPADVLSRAIVTGDLLTRSLLIARSGSSLTSATRPRPSPGPLTCQVGPPGNRGRAAAH